MRKTALFFLITICILFGLSPRSVSAAQFDTLENYSVTPTTWTGDPSTVFTFSGKIDNCPADYANNVPLTPSRLYLAIETQDGTYQNIFYFKIHNDGTFSVQTRMIDSDNQSHKGVWITEIDHDDNQKIQNAYNPLKITITDSTSGKPTTFACGANETNPVPKDAVCDAPCGTPQKVTLTGAQEEYVCMTPADAANFQDEANKQTMPFYSSCFFSGDVTKTCDTNYVLHPFTACAQPNTAFYCDNGFPCKMPNSDSSGVTAISCQTLTPAISSSKDAAPFPPCVTKPKNGHLDGCTQVNTVFGVVGTDPQSIIKTLLGIFLSLSGGIALLMIIRSGYQLITSRGNAEKIKEAQDRIISAVVGLLFSIFSLVVLEAIGVDILHIPGLGH